MQNTTVTAKCNGFGLALTAGALLLGGGSGAYAVQDDTSSSASIETALTGIDTWVELRGQIGKERAALEERKAFLNDRIELLRSEIDDTRKVTETQRGEVSKGDTKIAELEAENEKLKNASETLKELIAPLEARTLELLGRMPAPLVESVRDLSQNIPADPMVTELSLSKRYQQVVGVLNFIDKFNTDVHVATETREIAAGVNAQVTALYLGVSSGYYVNSGGDRAGRGFAKGGEFVWTPTDGDAAEIQMAVKVLNGELPQFVQVPIAVD